MSPSPWAAWRSWATTAGWPWRSSQTLMRCCCGCRDSSGFDALEDPGGEFGDRQVGRAAPGTAPAGPRRGPGRPPGSWRGIRRPRIRAGLRRRRLRCAGWRPTRGVDVEQHRQVRLQARGGPFVDVPDGVRAEAAAGALVGDRGVDVAVGEDDLAALQRGADDLAGVGGPGRRENQGLGVGIDVAVAVVQHEGPQLFADRGAARFPGPQHRQAA